MRPDIYIKIRFKTTSEGGRKSSINRKRPSGPDFYACPLIANDKAYECRLLIGDKKIELGKYYKIPVKFLEKDLVMPHLSIGEKILLWEGKVVAEGIVVEIVE